MKKINFSYLIKEDKSKNIIINYGNEEEIILDIEKECLENISRLNNFILIEIAKNEELEFVFNENGETEAIKNIIEAIKTIYSNEYNEIIKNIKTIEANFSDSNKSG